MGLTYQWYLNHQLVAAATSNVFTIASVTDVDTVDLNVISNMPCPVPDSGAANEVIISTNVGVANISAGLDNIALYPNPNSGTFTIKGDMSGLNTNSVSFEITNILGQVITPGDIAVANEQLDKTIELGNVAPGLYLIRIYEGGEDKIFRFSVQH